MTDTPTTVSPVRAAGLADDQRRFHKYEWEDARHFAWVDEVCSYLRSISTALSRAKGEAAALVAQCKALSEDKLAYDRQGVYPVGHAVWAGKSLAALALAVDLLEAQSLALAEKDAEVARLQQQVREFACEEHDVTLGVGRGDGQLFVHGNHESIQAVRAIIAERAALLRRIAELEAQVKAARSEAKEAGMNADKWMRSAMRSTPPAQAMRLAQRILAMKPDEGIPTGFVGMVTAQACAADVLSLSLSLALAEKDADAAHFAGEPLPPPTGKGTAARLSEDNKRLRAALHETYLELDILGIRTIGTVAAVLPKMKEALRLSPTTRALTEEPK